MPSQEGQLEPDGSASGTVQCPGCWAVWFWEYPVGSNYLTDEMNGRCPRCDHTIGALPACVRQITRQPDLAGFPSE